MFQNNSAYYQGGAIYILLNDHFNIEVSRSCFIQYANDSGDIEIDDDIDSTYSFIMSGKLISLSRIIMFYVVRPVVPFLLPLSFPVR